MNIKIFLDLEELVQSYLERTVDENSCPMWLCVQCGKTSNKLGNIRDHIEARHIEGLQLKCHFCLKTLFFCDFGGEKVNFPDI